MVLWNGQSKMVKLRCWTSAIISHLCAVEHCHVEEGVLHVRANSLKSCFQLNQCQAIPESMIMPVGLNSECTKPLSFQETISMTSPARTAIFNFFFGTGYLSPWTISICWIIMIRGMFSVVMNSITAHHFNCTCITHYHVSRHNSEPSSGRRLAFGPTVWKSLTNWMQFSLNSYVCFSYVTKLRGITFQHPFTCHQIQQSATCNDLQWWKATV